MKSLQYTLRVRLPSLFLIKSTEKNGLAHLAVDKFDVYLGRLRNYKRAEFLDSLKATWLDEVLPLLETHSVAEFVDSESSVSKGESVYSDRNAAFTSEQSYVVNLPSPSPRTSFSTDP